MDSAATTLVPAIWGEALKSWGAYALVLMLLGAICWLLAKRLTGKEAENAALRAEIAILQEKRLQDATALVKVTVTATETIAARGQGDKDLTKMLAALADELAAVKDWMKEAFGPRRTRSR